MFIIDVNNLLNENQKKLANQLFLRNDSSYVLFSSPKKLSVLPCGIEKYSSSVSILYTDDYHIPCVLVKKAILYAQKGNAFAMSYENKFLKSVIVHSFEKPFKILGDSIVKIGRVHQQILDTYNGNLITVNGKLQYDCNGKIYSERPINFLERTYYTSEGKVEKRVVLEDKKDNDIQK